MPRDINLMDKEILLNSMEMLFMALELNIFEII